MRLYFTGRHYFRIARDGVLQRLRHRSKTIVESAGACFDAVSLAIGPYLTLSAAGLQS